MKSLASHHRPRSSRLENTPITAKSSAIVPLRATPRNSMAPAVKQCELEFAERYGEIGKGFIEAHHLRPIATLEEGVPVKYDVAADFAVLCSNCHRMIHRFTNPSDLTSFRAAINK